MRLYYIFCRFLSACVKCLILEFIRIQLNNTEKKGKADKKPVTTWTALKSTLFFDAKTGERSKERTTEKVSNLS